MKSTHPEIHYLADSFAWLNRNPHLIGRPAHTQVMTQTMIAMKRLAQEFDLLDIAAALSEIGAGDTGRLMFDALCSWHFKTREGGSNGA